MSTTYSAAGPVAGLTGQPVLPGDPDYDRGRQAWNLALDQRPVAVIWPESAPDVAAAAGRGLRIAAQGTGHGAAPLGPLDGTILLRTERMGGIRIDPRTRITHAEAGVAWLDVVEAAARHGLAALAGSSPDTGVTGCTLGGGINFLGRTFGLAANSVTAIEVVTADGHLVPADHEHQPDLFWALRGGGGSFGVVTALEFRLFPVTEAYAGALWYPVKRESEVLHAWAELTRGAPDELTTVGRFLRLPPLPSIRPRSAAGRSSSWRRTTSAPGRRPTTCSPRCARSVRSTTRSQPCPCPRSATCTWNRNSRFPWSATASRSPSLPGEAIDALVTVAGADAPPGLISVEIRHLGGKLPRPRPGNGALASLDEEYALYAVGATPVPDLVAPVMARIVAIKDALAPWTAPRMCLNFAETRHPAAPFWTEQAYRRLRQIKAAVDPGDLIQANHPVPPTLAGG